MEKKLEWDDEVPQDIARTWKKWLGGIKENNEVQIDRCYHHHGCQCSNIQGHIFCDASESAYGVVAYLLVAFKGGTTGCCFVMRKSRLAPIRILTMSRLELKAGVFGVKVYNIIIYKIDLPIENADQNYSKIRQGETFVRVNTIKNGLIDDKRYSRWQSIAKVMGWLERFCFNLMAKIDKKQCQNGKMTELLEAQKLICKNI